MSGLYVCTSMTRTDADGDFVHCDMLIRFRVVSFTKGSPEVRYQRNGDPGWPAEPAEYEFEVTGIEFDAGPAMGNVPPDDANWPLTDDEDAILRQWFDANHDLACMKADDDSECHGPDPDAAYERRRDEADDRARDCHWDNMREAAE